MISVSNITYPLLVSKVAGKPLRFFRSPKAVPDFPWHALDDLFAALDLSPEMRRAQLRCSQRWLHEEIRTVATDEGPTTIGPHVAAQGFLAAAVQARVGAADFATAYSNAAAAALNVMTDGMPPIAAFEFMMTAARNAGIGGCE